MLTRWSLENFKPIRKLLDLPTAPLTVLAGLNSSGKSSFLQSILLIAQTLANQKLDDPLVLNGGLVRFGTFPELCNDRASEPRLRIGFTLTGETRGYALSPSRSDRGGSEQDTRPVSISMDMVLEEVAPGEPLEEGHGLQGVRASLSAVNMRVVLPELSDDSTEDRFDVNVSVKRATPDEESRFVPRGASGLLRYLPYPPGQNYIASITGASRARAEVRALVRLAHIVPLRYIGRPPWGRLALTLRPSDRVRVAPWGLALEQAAQHVINTFSSAVRYLGPLRVEPQVVQSYSPSGQPDDVGSHGEYAAAVYASNRKQAISWWNPDIERVETAALEDAMDVWLRYLGVADHVSTRDAAVPGVSWMVRTGPGMRERPLQAVGVGVSQVLPILVAGLLAPQGTILIMEQPEFHLHERPQARLGNFFYGLTRVGKQVFVETHSAVLVSQLRFLMVKHGQEVRDAIAIYFVSQDEEGDAHFEPIRISRGGAIENWPDGFFDESFRLEDRITQEGIRARSRRSDA